MTGLVRGDAPLGGSTAGSGAAIERVEGQHSGHYRLGRRIGTGRRGPILEAQREPGSRRTVVWLRPFDEADASSRLDSELRFLRGAAIRTSVRHANLVRVLDYGTAGDRGFLVTDPPPEYTLASILSTGPLDSATIARVGVGIASGLAHLHDAGLAHGSLVPERVALAFAGDEPVPRLLDDGLEPATPDTVARDLAMLAELVRTMGERPVEMGPAEPLPIVFEDLLVRLCGPEASAADAVLTFREWLAAAPRSAFGGALLRPTAPSFAHAPVERVSDWWWIIGSVAGVVVSLLVVGLGAVGVTQSLLVGTEASLSTLPGVRTFEVVEDAATVTVDGVRFTVEDARRTLSFVNHATPEALRTAGIHASVVGRILAERPFASVEAFGATRGIGPRSVAQAAKAASR